MVSGGYNIVKLVPMSDHGMKRVSKGLHRSRIGSSGPHGAQSHMQSACITFSHVRVTGRPRYGVLGAEAPTIPRKVKEF